MHARPAIAAALLLVACGSGSPATTARSTPEPTQAPAPAALVQVENNAAARPQWGLQHAAAVYEYVTEGGITRFSALYTSPPPDRVGPVRSARLVTIHLAKALGAVIVYSGASIAVQQALDSSQLPHADENSAHGALYRIGERQVPHNLVTDGGHLATLLDGFRGRAPAPPALWQRSSSPPASGGQPVSRVMVPITDSERPVFSYDAGAGGWTRSEPDTGSFLDAAGKQPVVAATVVLQQVQIEQTHDVEDVNGAFGVDITITGSGAAQVFTAGREYDATWTQPASGVASFTLPGGGSAPVAPGLVWICLVATGTRAQPEG